MQKKFNYLLIVALLTLISNAGFSQSIGGQSFHDTICVMNANSALDLGLDVAGTDLTLAGGYWDRVMDTITTPSGYDPATYPAQTITSNVSNVFNMVGSTDGVYTFVYTATNNLCLPSSEKVLVKIVILKNAVDVSHNIYLCDTETKTLDLDSIVDPSIPDVVFDFSTLQGISGSAANPANNEISIDAIYDGTFTIQYYSTTTPCSDTSLVTVNVTRGTGAVAFTNDTVAVCENQVSNPLSLTTLSGATASNGTWSTSATGITFINASNGVFEFDNLPPALGYYDFTYTYTDCNIGTLTKDFVVQVSDDLTPLFNNSQDSICISEDPTLVYDLMADGFGISVPANSGTWTELQIPAGAPSQSLTNGMFLVSQARTGTYVYKYTFSSAATNLCGLAGQTQELTLIVGDIGGVVQDGRVEICVDDVASATGNFNLSDFVPGLSNASVSNVTWTGPTGVSIVGAGTNEVSYADLNTLGIGTHLFEFAYNSPGCDVNNLGAGYLYLTVTDDLDMNDATYEYCRPDIPAPLNLNQAIGVDIAGAWAVTSVTGTGNPGSGYAVVGNLFTEDGAASGNVTYVITFTPDPAAGCNATPVTVTIKVSDDSFGN